MWFNPMLIRRNSKSEASAAKVLTVGEGHCLFACLTVCSFGLFVRSFVRLFVCLFFFVRFVWFEGVNG